MIPNEPSGSAPPPPPPPGGDPLTDDQPSMMPLGTGSDTLGEADAMLDPLSGGGVKKRIPTGPLLIVLVVIVAVVGLFSMRTISTVWAGADTNEEIEKIVEDFFLQRTRLPGTEDPKELPGEASKAIDMLAAAYTDQQVALRDVQKNPFVIYRTPEEAPKSPVYQAPTDDTEERIAAFKTKANAAATTLELSGVFMGTTPMATIDGEIMMVGDEVYLDRSDLTFVVTNIKQGSADIECTDPDTGTVVKVTLSIDSGVGKDKKKKRSRRG